MKPAQIHKILIILNTAGRHILRYGGSGLAIVCLLLFLPVLDRPYIVLVSTLVWTGSISTISLFVGIGPALFATVLSSLCVFVIQEPVGKQEEVVALIVMGILLFGQLATTGVIYLFKKRTQQLVAFEKHFRTLIEESLHPIILKNKNGYIIYASSSISELVGWSPVRLIGTLFQDYIHPDDQATHQSFFHEVLAHPKKRMRSEVRMRKKDGTWVWIRNVVMNMLYENTVGAVVSSLQDISKQKYHLEQEQAARKVAERAVQTRDEFLSIASHELKTPLTTIVLQLQATLRRILTQSMAQFSGEKLLRSLTIAEEQSQRLNTLIQDLLNVSLISTGRIDLKKEPVDLSRLAYSVAGQLEGESEHQLISVHAQNGIVGLWDKVRIEQCVANLMTNALKYGGGKPIIVSVWQEAHTAYIAIKDQGIGIKPEELSVIFEPFKRSTDAQMFSGVGVGLFIAHQIVRAHGGEIWVQSVAGKGSTFTIGLPRR